MNSYTCNIDWADSEDSTYATSFEVITPTATVEGFCSSDSSHIDTYAKIKYIQVEGEKVLPLQVEGFIL